MISNNNYSYRPDEERLSRIEKIWGVRLPEEIRILLMEDNGGVPEKRNFPCGKRTRMIVRFLCIKEKGTDEDYAWYDINVVLTQLEERIISDPDLVGYEIIPIAELFAGDYLCLDYRESDTPTVCVWLHEESEEWNPVTEKVADSFSEFMDMLSE